MAIEPYRPTPDQNTTNREQELEKKIAKLFERWNWKLFRFLRAMLFLAIGVWLAVNLLPGIFNVIITGEIGTLFYKSSR